MSDHQFALSGAALPGGDDLFGVWYAPPATPDVGVAFDASAPAAPAAPVWRIQLPASLDEAEAALETRRSALRRGEVDMATAEERLDRVGSAGGPAVAFDVTTGPEAELLGALSAAKAPVSFDVDADVGAAQDREREATRRDWRDFVAQVQDMVTHAARVETNVGETFVGYTEVDWTGDFETVWEPGVTPAHRRLHHESLHLTLAWRMAMLRLLVVVGAGAVRLAIRASVPGAQLTLLPAVYKYIREVVQELRQLPQPQIS